MIKKSWIYILFYLLLFQDVLQSNISIFKGLDEAIVIIFLIMTIFKILYNRLTIIKKNTLKILLSMCILFLIGIIGNIINDYQPIKYAIEDIIITFKGFSVYIMALFLLKDIDIKEDFRNLNKHLKIISVSIFSITMLNLIFKFLPSGDYRLGFNTQMIFFSHQTYLASFCVVIISLLAMYTKDDSKNHIYILLLDLVIITTGRTKAIAFIGIYYFIYFITIYKNRKLIMKDFILVGSMAVIISIQKITTYIENTNWARSKIYSTSIQIAIDKFPIGSGFGSFASWVSGKYYSNIYYEYGLNNVYGLSKSYYSYIADSFWPMVLGQFGLFGLIIYIYILLQIYKNIKYNKNMYKYCSQILLYTYTIILSTSESSFSSPVAVLYFILIAVFNNTTE